MLALPDCPAATILRANFRHSQDSALIEEWVNSVIAEPDRSQCFGRTALSRAMRKLGVVQCDDDDMLYDGELRLVHDRRVAFVRTGQYSRRERFTIAHELGHASLHVLDPSLDQGEPRVERVCNLFAGELLMPTRLVRDIWTKQSDANAIVVLAGRTGSSLSASCVRITECLDVTTGLVSPDGKIMEPYGDIPVRELEPALRLTCGRASAGRSALRLPNGLKVSTGRAGARTVFLAQRLSAPLGDHWPPWSRTITQVTLGSGSAGRG
jgi:hypothetical protein